MTTCGVFNLPPKLIEVAGKILAPEHSNKLPLGRQDGVLSCYQGTEPGIQLVVS